MDSIIVDKVDSPMKVLVTGASGLLGSTFVKVLSENEYEVVTHSHQSQTDYNADLTDYIQTNKMLDEIMPDSIVHLACLSNVDRCELEPDLAYQLNVKTLENIVEWSKLNKNLRLIFISTDHVYDSSRENKEEDVKILNTYAFSKYCAEKVAAQIDSVILRTNFFGKSETSQKQSFSDWVTEMLNEEGSINLVNDVYFSPLLLDTLSNMIVHVLGSDKTGVYNLGSHNGMTKANFAYKLARKYNLSFGEAKEISVNDINLSAVRPKGMNMDVSKFEKTFNIELPTLDEEIDRMV